MTLGLETWPPAFPKRARLASLSFSPLLSAAHNLDTVPVRRLFMKKFFARAVVAFALVFAVSVPVLADTIRLKDGSVIRGQIVSFKNEQFTILVGTGTRGRKSRVTVYMEDVDSIEFDGAPADEANNTSSAPNEPPYQPPANTRPNNTRPSNPSPPQTSNPNTSA